jgi:GPH family glycoside/pentoside/hexuronide:cation symporter
MQVDQGFYVRSLIFGVIGEQLDGNQEGMMETLRTTKFEKFAFGLGGFGAQFCWGFISTYITIYLTDSVMIAAGLIGTVLMLSRFLDGITDIIMGYIVDNTHTRLGKAKPWILLTAIPVGVLTYMCFNVPESFSYTGKVVYIAITYVLVSAILFTANNVAYQSLASFMTNDKKDRITLGTVSYLFLMFAWLVVGFTPTFQKHFFGSINDWHGISIIYSIICVVCLIFTGLSVKERNVNENLGGKRESFFKSFKALLTDKYFLLIFGVFIAVNMKSTAGAAGIYYVTYILKNTDYNGILTMASTIPFLIGILFAAPIVSKFGIRRSATYGFAFACLGFVIAAIFSNSLIGLCIGIAITYIGYIPAAAAQAALTASVADHVYWKSGIPAQGTTFSCSSATVKIGAGIASALVGILLTAGHYVPNGDIQPDTAIFAIKALYIYIPGIFTVLAAIFMYFIDLEKFLPHINKDVAEGKVGANRTPIEAEIGK